MSTCTPYVEVFEQMQRDGVEANIFTYSALISACAKGKQWNKALEVFEDLQRVGIEADAITYSAMISACEKGRQVDKALEVETGPDDSFFVTPPL